MTHHALAAAALALLAVGLFASPASAITTHPYESRITEANGQALVNPSGLSVDGSGNLWVSDAHPGGTVSKFSSAGNFLAQTSSPPWSGTYIESLAFSAGAGEIFVADSDADDLWGLDPATASYSGTDLKPLGATTCCFIKVAADNSGTATDGDLYVSNGSSVIRIDGLGSASNFTAGPAAGTNKLSGPFSSTRGLAVGPGGNFYVADSNAVYQFAPSGEYTGLAISSAGGHPLSSVLALAVDPTSGNVLAADFDNHEIDEFDPSGTFLGRTSTANGSPLGRIKGLAVDSSGTLYAADETAAAVDVFGPPLPLPDATTEAAGEVTETTARLHGTVNPKGIATTYQFEYGTSTAYGQKAPAAPAAVGNDSSDHAESIEVTGLQPSTVYHFRIDAIGGPATNTGADFTFRTTGPPTIGAYSVTEIGGVNATIKGQVNPSGFDTHYWIEYGSTSAYGSETAHKDIGSSSEVQATSDELSGLDVSTTYHYRVVAENASGTVQSEDRTFSTEPAVRIVEQSVSGIEPTCVTLEAQVNPNGTETSVVFEYGETHLYGSATGATMLSASTTPQPVTTEVCGLTNGGQYHFRAVASNALGSAKGSDEVFATLGFVQIDAVSVLEIGATEATFSASIEPQGKATSYRFEYGIDSSYGSVVPVPDGSLSGGETEAAITETIEGLAPKTTYHYRLVAANSDGTTVTRDRTFTTQPTGASTLADGRAYELVSPAEKFGASINAIGETGVVQAAANGNAITYVADSAIEPEPQGVGAGPSQVLSTRGPAGWISQDLATPHDRRTNPPVGPGKEYRGFSDDLAYSFVNPFGAFTPSISPQASEQSAFVRTNYLNGNPGEQCTAATMDCYRPLVTGAPGVANVPAGTHFAQCYIDTILCGPQFKVTSPDGKHALVVSNVPLTAEPVDEGAANIYEWSAEKPSAEQLQLVSILPGSAKEPATTPFIGYRSENLVNTLSADGTRAIYTAQAEAFGSENLYLRDTARNETIQLDAPEAGCGACEGGEGRFQFASRDGSHVFFTDERPLTADSGAQPFLGADLYECRITEKAGKLACDLADLTPAINGAPAEVLNGILGASQDGSWVYFTANGVLTTETDSNGEQARPGECLAGQIIPNATCNLYAYHQGEIRLVSVLSGRDYHNWYPNLRVISGRVSSNGEWLAFMSQRALIGNDNRDAVTGEPDAQVYLYDAAAGKLLCASCDPTGARPHGVEFRSISQGFGIAGSASTLWDSAARVAANVTSWTGNEGTGNAARHQPRYLSETGQVFFTTINALVPQDGNGTQDVYEFELPGTGSCSVSAVTFSEQTGGCTNLISSGGSAEESTFFDASESGDDVFILTASRLVRKDTDSAFDIYDARVGGGEIEAPALPSCEGDACQLPAIPPQDPTPTSLGFAGAGNVHESKAKAKHRHKKKKQTHRKHRGHHGRGGRR